MPDPALLSRRAALGLLASACAGLLTGASRRPRVPHPDPRPGIDASHILPPERVAEYPDAVAAFDEARAIPGILDGLRCQCGCADRPGKRSVLSCYEEDGMALDCEICRGVARLAYRLHGKGRSLAEIRDAVDARYGG
ncbi:MAG TPA: PCYCGC motif-containing (lipo)protein [Gemmatimonadales bacterium]|nr:PCYCGC motif-containing (lipo)protein [Gemmatimonadales bacterium]